MDFLTDNGRINKKFLVEFLDAPTNNEVIYFTRSTHEEERQVEQEIDLDGASDTDSVQSPKTEIVQVTKLHMSMELPEKLHPHKMDLISVNKKRPVKVPNPTTKKDGREEMYRYLLVLLIDQDPAVILAAHLDMNSPNKYERALCRTMTKIGICHTSNNMFPVPECHELFEVPFDEEEIAKNADIVNRLTDSCTHWYETIEKTVGALPSMDSLRETSPIDLPREQIKFWRERQKDLTNLIDEFTFPAFERAVGIMQAAKVKEVDKLHHWMDQTSQLLEEADDHVRCEGGGWFVIGYKFVFADSLGLLNHLLMSLPLQMILIR